MDNLDELDVDKLVPVPVDISKLNSVVENDVVKKDVYNAKIKNIKGKVYYYIDSFNAKINEVKNKILINEVKNKIPSITNSATNASFNVRIN